MKKTSQHSTFILVLALLLVACGSEAVQQSSTSQPVWQPNATLPTAEILGDTLPGRLLFVRNGTIWLWEGRQAIPWLGEGQVWQPDWSPDGTQIAYVERGESYSDLILADASGATTARLTLNSSTLPSRSHERIYDSMWALYPSWSPDGKTIAMASQPSPPTGAPAIEYNLALYVVPATGGARVQVYSDSEAQTGHIVYTHDGRALVYTRAAIGSGGQQRIYRLMLDTQTSTLFPGAPARSYDPAFSPDGTWLAFASRDTSGSDIWVLPGNPTDGSSPMPRRLTSIGSARSPVFSPDGQTLAFLAIPPGEHGFDLWVSQLSLREDGTLQAAEPRQLTKDMRIDADSGLSWAQ